MKKFPPLSDEDRPMLTTSQAAWYLQRMPATLYDWHAEGRGPLTPIKVGGRLMWRTSDVRKLLEGDRS